MKFVLAMVIITVIAFCWMMFIWAPGVEADCRARGGETRWLTGLSRLCLTPDGRVL